MNYFYWYGHLFSYLPNPKYNWIKQFVRFTDSGHIASFLPLFYKPSLPLCHNVHFVIMTGYWIGKLVFGISDADRQNSSEANTIIEWHMDLCTYIHHSVPYSFIYLLWKENMDNKKMVCNDQYEYNSLFYTYVWLYIWFLFIYMPWRLYTKDCVYSILDSKQTPLHLIFFFVAFVHFLIYVGNKFAFMDCIFYQAEPQGLMYEL